MLFLLNVPTASLFLKKKMLGCSVLSFHNPTGFVGGGHCRHQHHPGGGEGAEGQCKRPGPDPIPRRGPVISVSAMKSNKLQFNVIYS